MKPTNKLLKPARASARAAKATTIVREHEVLSDRKRTLEVDIKAVKSAGAVIPKHLDDLLVTIRKDSIDRPIAIAGAVVIRVLGAICDDKTPVPLPNLRVTITGADKTVAHALTDVTGLAVLPEPQSEKREDVDYKLTVTASDGATVATAEGTRTRTHVLTLGDAKSLEAHATLGRGWLAAIDRAEKLRDKVVKNAGDRVAVVDKLTTTRITAITKRLDLHLKK
jgi:hypothetical protein